MAAYVLTSLAALALAYLCGSIPVALLVGWAFGGIDIRQHGSGNTGTANALRTLGWLPGMLVFVGDALKGALGCLLVGSALSLALAWNWGMEPGWAPAWAQTSSGETSLALTTGLPASLLVDLPMALASIACILGHMFSPFMGFKGGKGVATALGALLVVLPVAALCALTLFLLALLITRIVSLSSIIAVLSVPIFTALFYGNSPTYIVFALLLALAVVLAHKKNIVRIAKGQEPRFSVEKKKGRA